MNIIIRLPEKTGFDIEVDDNLIHSLYEHTEQTLFLKKGKHSITIKDLAPTPSLWY